MSAENTDLYDATVRCCGANACSSADVLGVCAEQKGVRRVSSRLRTVQCAGTGLWALVMRQRGCNKRGSRCAILIVDSAVNRQP